MFQPNIDTMREALFASHVQASDQPDSRQISTVIATVLRQFGPQYCAERVAEEYGDHPETAAARMRWIREAVRGGTTGGSGRPADLA
ncbi:hypothetical protein [Hamadaea tsunoensis]|uniref:hypothetical protein n=1 Tax=Hamadaea tsunoensis TaxID=53368 RepID=UPI00041B8E74|nr:hypothetical protein [Hamadaea tsunoensis]